MTDTVPSSPDTTIVVSGKRPDHSPLDGVTPQETLPAETLATYGANSIGELLARLKQQEGDPPPDIVINGQRLGSIADLAELPAEAIANIVIYKPSDGRRFGFSGQGRVLNVVLQKHFSSRSLEVESKADTDGGRQTGRLTTRIAKLEGNRRFNASLTANASGQLRAGERPVFTQGSGGAQASETGQTGAADRALLPEMLTLTGTAGMSLPLGGDNLAISAQAGLTRTSALLQVADAGSSQAIDNNPRRLNDSNQQSLSATWSGMSAPWFMSVSGTLNRSQSHIQVRGGGAGTLAEGGGAFRQNLSTVTTGASLFFSGSGPLLSLPTGAVQLRVSGTYTQAGTATRDRVLSRSMTSHNGQASGQMDLSLPLTGGKLKFPSWAGTLELAPGLSYNGRIGGGQVLGHSLGLDWGLTPELRFHGEVRRTPSLPSNDQLNAPMLVTPGVNVYDYRAGGLVAVEQITGGAPLVRSETRGLNLTASYSRRVGSVQANLYTAYSATREIHPQISLTEPSPLLEAQFPDRFIRDSAGHLTQVDSRPFNADSSRNRSLSANLSFYAIPRPPRAGQGGEALPSPAARPWNWNVNLGVDYALSRELILGSGMAPINLLSRPLSVGTSAPSRLGLRTMAGIGRADMGANLSYNWKSAAHSASQSGAGSVVQRAMGTLDLAAFKNFGKAVPHGGGRPATAFRLKLSVQNVFNTRARIFVQGLEGRYRLNPWLLEPEGRTVSLSLQVQ